jgi:glycosyltransferase involved in cell wall biosynthesis
MRVLYVGGVTSAQKGAVGTHTGGVLRAFQSLGVELHALFLSDQIPDYYDGPMTVVPASAGRGLRKKVADRVRIARAARKRSRDYDYLYTRYDPVTASMVVGENVILEYNDDFMDQIRFAVARGQYGRLATAIRGSAAFEAAAAKVERRCFAKARLVVGVTQKLCDIVSRREPRSRTFCMLNGSDAAYCADLDPRHGDAVLRLGHIGTLTHWDGLEELVKAIALFRATHPSRHIRLIVVGDVGGLKPRLHALTEELELADLVEFRPSGDHRVALAALHEVDVVPLLKTIASYDLSPIKFYEALCVGRFVLCSDIPHINELDSRNGIVVAFPLDVGEIARALAELHDRIGEIRGGFAARSLEAQQAHSWRNRVAGLIAVLAGEPRAETGLEATAGRGRPS